MPSQNVGLMTPVNALDVIDVTLTLDTSIYASGDVLAVTQEVANALRIEGGRARLLSIVVNDKDDLGVAFDLVFLRSNVALGTINAAPSITDTDADEILGIVSIATGDYVDLGGCRVATKIIADGGLPLKGAAASSSLWLAAITRGGTPTYTNGITLKLGLLRD